MCEGATATAAGRGDMSSAPVPAKKEGKNENCSKFGGGGIQLSSSSSRHVSTKRSSQDKSQDMTSSSDCRVNADATQDVSESSGAAALCVSSEAAATENILQDQQVSSSRTSTPPPQDSHIEHEREDVNGDGQEQGGREHEEDHESCHSSLSSPNEEENETRRQWSSSSSTTSVPAVSTEEAPFQLDTATIEEIAAKAAAAAAAAVFGARTALRIQEPSPAYSVQTLDVDTPQGSITDLSPAIQHFPIPLPIFGAGHSLTHGILSGKKRRRSNDSSRRSSATTASVADDNDAPADSSPIGSGCGKKRALFFPTKTKKRSPKRSNSDGSSASEKSLTYPASSPSRRIPSPCKPRALIKTIDAKAATAHATTSVPSHPSTPRASARVGSSVVQVRTVPPTVQGIHEAARILLSSAITNPLAYPLSPTVRPCPPPGSTTGTASTSNTSFVNTNYEGILSFPTETVYTLTTCITVKPLLRSSSTSSASSCTSASEEEGGRFPAAVHSPSLTRLLHLKGRLSSSPSPSTAGGAKNATNRTEDDDLSSTPPALGAADPDPPLLYMHTPTQAREFVHFTKPKTFILKPSSDPNLAAGGNDDKTVGSGGGTCGRLSPKCASKPAQVPAVTLSESREVLDRLTNTFWPGPVIIYAKCKMRRALREKHLPPIREESSLSPIKMTSLERRSSEEDEVIYAPILPTSILHLCPNSTASAANDTDTDSPYYVGMRCPSHPLARRVLEEVYIRNKKRQQQPGGRRARSRVVLGFSARSSTCTSCPTNAQEVSSQLSGVTVEYSCPHDDAGGDEDGASTSFVDVLNGEDEREMFAAPTCQFGVGASISLVIDDEAKTIRIVKPKESSATSSTIQPKDVVRALCTNPRSSVEVGAPYEAVAADAEKVASRVISVVLNRWKVTEETY